MTSSLTSSHSAGGPGVDPRELAHAEIVAAVPAAHTLWHVKASTLCNLRCRYCYEWDRLADRTRLALDQWQRAIDIARQTGAAHALPDVLMARGGTLWLSGRVQEARDSHIEGWQLLRDVPGDAVSMRTLTIQLQILDRQLGHYTSSLAHAEQVMVDAGVVKLGDVIVLTIGEPIGQAGGTNTMKIVKVGEHRQG